MAVLVGAVRDHNERPSVIASAPHIAKRLRNRVIKTGAILSDTGLRNRLEDPLRVAGKVDDFVHLSMELQLEDFVDGRSAPANWARACLARSSLPVESMLLLKSSRMPRLTGSSSSAKKEIF